MYHSPIKVFRWLVALTTVLAALELASAGTAAADFEAPVVFSVPGSSTPNCVSVNWDLPLTGGSGVAGFSVQREQPYYRWNDIHPSQRDLWTCGMDPSTFYRFEVCAYYFTDEGDTECSHADLRTSDPQPPQASEDPPAPRIVDTQRGYDWVGVKWEAGHPYDAWFINWTLKDPRRGPVSIPYDDDGTWGYYHIGGLLPSRTYIIQVQGCTETIFGLADDHCWDWSAPVEVTTHAYPLDSGPDTCAPGWVWREAFDGDTVCVTPARRDQVAADNGQAENRREGCTLPGSAPVAGRPNCTFVMPDYCIQGFVWREARPPDHVCVTPAERDLIRTENNTAWERYAQPR
jgi:hypothetical protein